MTTLHLIRLLLAGALALPLLAACGRDHGPISTEEREVGDVVAVELATSGHLTITRADEPSLTVTAGERVLPRLTSEVVDGVLVLGRQASTGWGGSGPVEYHLALPALEALSVRGSGDVLVEELTGELALTVEGSGDVDVASAVGEVLAVELAGSGDVRVAGVEVDDVQVRLEGSGEITLAGRTDTQHVTLTGSGAYEGGGLDSADAVVTVEGSGDADVEVREHLTAVVAGSGDVTHGGGAEVVSEVDGSGGVHER